jgi:stage III sporulation protein AD
MEQIVRIAFAGICGIVIVLAIKKQNPETAMLLVLAVSALILAAALPILANIKAFIDDLGKTAGLSPAIIMPLIKILVISIISRIGSDACTDCDAKAVGACIEIAGAACAVYVALPLLSSALKLIASFI